MSIAHGPRQPVELGDHERVAVPARCQRLPQALTVGIAAREAVVDVDSVRLDTEGSQTVALRGEVLFVGGTPGVTDLQFRHAHKCFTYGPVTGHFTGRGIRDTRAGEPARSLVSCGSVR